MTAEEFLAYEEQALPAIIQKYAGFDFEKYYASLQEQADRQAREFEINNNPGQQPLNNPTNNEQPTESTTDGAGSQVLPREESSNQPREANAGQPEAGRPEGTGNDGLQSPVSQGTLGEGAHGGEQTKGNVRVDDGRGGDGSPAGRQPSDLAQAEEINYQLSDEVDENGHQFVLNSDGKIEFGRIGEDTGLTQAPILLSEGIITNKKTNAGYGLLHIEARHGDQIRAAGYDSVLEFIEEVAKNYEVIRKGNDREGRETYMLQLTDKHNNTLMVELSGDGTYWNINTAGIFKTSYGANRDVVYARHTTDNQPAEADEASLSGEQSGTTPSTRMNAPAQSYQNSVLDNTRDTGKTLMGNGNDTATPENTISSADKGKQNQPQSETKQTETAESLPNNISEQVKAAEAQTNTNPTEAQKQAGNYKKGHLRIDGFDISIENPKGSVRRGTDPSGRQWEQKMNNTYGYLRGTEGVDGDHIDLFLSDTPEDGDIFVIDQVSKDGTFDEHKVMYGFPTEESARQAYLANYEEGWQGLGAITRVSREEFKKWVQSSHRKTKPFAEYKGVKTKQETTHKTAYADQKTTEAQEKQTQNADKAAKPAERIEDAGEKIGGARKDIARSMADRINLKGETFSTIFKKFDLRKLVEQGLDAKLAAGFKFIYEHAKSRFKGKKKIDEIRFIANYAKGYLLGDTSVDYSDNGWIFTDYGKRLFELNTELYGRLHDEFGDELFDVDLSGCYINVADKPNGYTYFRNGEEINMHYNVCIGRNNKLFTAEERDEALNYFIEGVKESVSYKKAHPYELSVYRERGKDKSYYVATKIRGEIVPLTPKGEMYDYKYIKDHNAELQAEARRIEEQKKEERKNAPKEKRAEIEKISVHDKNGYGYVWATKIGKEVHHVSEVFYNDKETFRPNKEALEAAKAQAQEKADALLQEYEERRKWKPEMNLGGMRSRVGVDYRKGQHATTEEILSTFGFRGIEFGNYVSQKERQKYLDECYDALMDMSSILGISPRAISLNGKLALAIGARGLGKASAHYEPQRNVINLTKKSGAGALAHEWWHAMDYYFGKDLEPGTEKVFADTTREEVRKAMERLSEIIKGSEYFKRSKSLDVYTNKEYYAKATELAARAFQDYIVKRLIERGQVNDFLSHFTLANDWNGRMEMYPYPLESDAAKINEAFSALFDTLMEREENGTTVLYHKAEIAKPVSKQEAALRDALVEIPRRAGMEVVTDAEEAQLVLDAENGENHKQDKILSKLPSVNVSKEEYAKISHAIFTYPNGRKNRFVSTDNNFYICTDIDRNGNFRIVFSLPIEGNEEIIDYIQNGKEDATDRRKESIIEFVRRNRNEQDRQNRGLLGIKESSESNEGDDFMDVGQKTNAGRDDRTPSSSTLRDRGIRFFRTKDGSAYGFVKDGKIYIDTRTARADTPIHEYTHLWAEAFRRVNPEGWKDIVRLMKGTDLWEQIRRQYPELTAEDELAEEVLAHYSGRSGAERLRAEQERILRGDADIVEKAAAVSAIQRVKEALSKFWRGVADWLGLRFTTAEEVADRVLADMLHGVNPAKVARSDGQGLRMDRNEEEAQIVARAKADGSYMKAPNGKPSRLSQQQWVQVRTRAFKDWFGDWERSARANLIKGLSKISIIQHSMQKEELYEKYKSLKPILKDGRSIEFYNGAFKKIYKNGGLFARIVPQLRDVFKQSIFAYEESDNLGGTTRKDGTTHKEHKNIVSYKNYIGKVEIDGKEYYVRFTVQEEESGLIGTHSYFVSNVGVYENPTENRTIPITSRGTTDFDGIVDAKIQQFFNEAKDCSNIVDENGEPLVVYHGSENRRIKQFNSENGMTWVSSMKGYAEAAFGKGGRTYSLLANIRNPLYVGNVGTYLNVGRFCEVTGLPYEEVVRISNGLGAKWVYELTNSNELRQLAIQHGYDGLEAIEAGGSAYATFTPTQIKSATNNVGTFSGQNPDIRYQLIGELGAGELDHKEESIFRLDNLGVARKMEKAGKDAKAIKLATGWERGADRNWRYEIEDGRFDIKGELHPERRRLSDSEKKELDDAFEETMKAFEKGSIAYKEEITKHTDMADIYEAGGMERKKAERIAYLEDKENRLKKMPKRLDDYLDNEVLFAAYPELRKVYIDTSEPEKAIFGIFGSYNPSKNTIKLNDLSHATLIHEVQHAIQHIEGFAIGGSKVNIRRSLSDFLDNFDYEYNNAGDKIRRSLRLSLISRSVKDGSDYREWIGSSDKEEQENAVNCYRDMVEWLDRCPESKLRIVGKDSVSLDELALSGYRIEEIISELRRLADLYKSRITNDERFLYNQFNKIHKALSNKSNYELYRHLSGEVEARNVSSRLGMTEEERRASLAAETEDVAREDQLFLADGLVVDAATNEKVSLEDVNERFNEELSGLTDENKDKVILSLGSPSNVLLSAGIKNRPMKLYGNKVIKKMKKHGFSLDELRNLPAAVADPIAVFDNIGREGNRSILTELKTEHGNFLVTVDLGKDADIDFNIVSSVFGKGSTNVIDWINKGFATYINKEKARLFLSHQSALIAAAAANKELVSAAKLVKDFKNPSLPSENLNDTAAYRQKSGEESAKAADNATTESKRNTAQQLADKLNTPIRIVESTDEITHPNPFIKARRRRAKGWYDRRRFCPFLLHNSLRIFLTRIIRITRMQMSLRHLLPNCTNAVGDAQTGCIRVN